MLLMPLSPYILLLSFFAATGLAVPTWYLAVFAYRCKAPYYVESYAEAWKEWRVSSICAPGTCCSNLAPTGPLCTVDACAMADVERERILASQRAQDALAEKKKEKEDASEQKKQEDLENGRKKEQEWKMKEAAEDAQKARIAIAEQSQSQSS